MEAPKLITHQVLRAASQVGVAQAVKEPHNLVVPAHEVKCA
jgi:hypothetical protein